MKKLIPLLIITTLAFGAVSATSFPAPTALPPAGNIVPVHTGINQTKNGNLSVNSFIARAIADFRQQIYINNTNLDKSTEGEKGNLKGSSVATAENANLVVFGGVIEGADESVTTDDVTYDTSIIGTDIITAKNYLQSWNVSHDATIAQKRDLCADADGNVVFCKVAIAEVDVCANIQGTQTNPPAGMVREGDICVWYVLPIITQITVRRIVGQQYTFLCEVQLDRPTIKTTSIDVFFPGGTTRTDIQQQSCAVTINAGDSLATTTEYISGLEVFDGSEACLSLPSLDVNVLRYNRDTVRVCR